MKDPAAVALGRKGGQKGGPARAAKLTSEQRSESARKAVQARWVKASMGKGSAVVRGSGVGRKTSEAKSTIVATSPSERAILALLERIRLANNPTDLRTLSDQLEHLIFRKQFKNG